MKCAISGEEIPELFLGKKHGTLIKDENGKRFWVSAGIQKEYNNDKQKMLEAIKNN